MLNLRLEFTKLKRRSFLLSLVVLISVLLMWSAVVIQSEWPKTHSVFNPLYDMAEMNDIIMPLFIAVLASRLLEMEHLGKTFKILQTSKESPWQLFKAKLALMMIFNLFVGIIQTVFVKLLIKGLGSSVSLMQLMFSLVSFVLVSLVLSCLHLSLAFVYEKASVTVVTGLVGSFLSLVGIGALPFAIRFFIPWQYFSMMGLARRIADAHTYLFKYDTSFPLKTVALLAIVIFSIYLSRRATRKADLL
ncbi:ABC transporter permease [Streptococcus dentapri]|uniref:ABC transporter permease n=1 Tax=Streptococcus dentapri TaxID=573564 RepID=A0ABV8D178_9STRE